MRDLVLLAYATERDIKNQKASLQQAQDCFKSNFKAIIVDPVLFGIILECWRVILREKEEAWKVLFYLEQSCLEGEFDDEKAFLEEVASQIALV